MFELSKQFRFKAAHKLDAEPSRRIRAHSRFIGRTRVDRVSGDGKRDPVTSCLRYRHDRTPTRKFSPSLPPREVFCNGCCDGRYYG
jgi:hypothetical protein